MGQVELKQYSGIEWYILAFKQYAVFKGRSSRLAFWFFAAYHFIVLILLGAADLVLEMIFEVGFRPLTYLYTLASTVPCLALASRRLHDANFSHWWLIGLVPKLIFTVLFWFAVSSSWSLIDDNMYFIYFIVGINVIAAVFTLVLLIFMLLASQPGSNQYGSNPYGINN